MHRAWIHRAHGKEGLTHSALLPPSDLTEHGEAIPRGTPADVSLSAGDKPPTSTPSLPEFVGRFNPTNRIGWPDIDTDDDLPESDPNWDEAATPPAPVPCPPIQSAPLDDTPLAAGEPTEPGVVSPFITLSESSAMPAAASGTAAALMPSALPPVPSAPTIGKPLVDRPSEPLEISRLNPLGTSLPESWWSTRPLMEMGGGLVSRELTIR